jgi:hypothetical protein
MKTSGGRIIRRHRNCVFVEPGTVASHRLGVRLDSIRGAAARPSSQQQEAIFGFNIEAVPYLPGVI